MHPNIYTELKNYSKYIYKSGLVVRDFGNVSVRRKDDFIIKASGRPMESISENDFVRVKYNGDVAKSSLRPSSDTPTHLELYNEYEEIGAIVHTHSPYATSWAQSGKSIPCFGTTHADYWCIDVPITRRLSKKEIESSYEVETGKVIIEKLKQIKLNPLECPGIIVLNHGPFAWGPNLEKAVEHAEVLEYIAKMAFNALLINPDLNKIDKSLLNKHFFRKHGPNAYYGQNEE